MSRTADDEGAEGHGEDTGRTPADETKSESREESNEATADGSDPAARRCGITLGET